MADLNVGKFGSKSNIDLNKLKAGMREKDLVNASAQEKSIFKAVDRDGNGVIDAGELNEFVGGLDKSQDSKRSRKNCIRWSCRCC